MSPWNVSGLGLDGSGGISFKSITSIGILVFLDISRILEFLPISRARSVIAWDFQTPSGPAVNQ